MASTAFDDAVRPSNDVSRQYDVEKSINPHSQGVETSSDGGLKADDDSEKFQNGVQRVRAITEIWTKQTLIAMFIFIFLIEFVAYLQNAIDASLNPWITSAFSRHGLLNVASVMSSALGGCIPLAVSKFIDVFGRVEGFFVMLLIILVGMALKAACNNVQTYIAGHVLYWAGHVGILYVNSIMVADMTTLKNRMVIFSLNETPRIASTFAGPAIADLFIKHNNWRWAFGAFIFLLIACSLPATGIMMYMYRKAKAAGVIHKTKSNRTVVQSISHHFIQFDIIGIILIMAAFCLFLLPFTLVSYAPQGWKTPYILAMIVLGLLLFPVFIFWEAKFTPVPFLQWKYLKEPTIIGSCALYGIMFISIFIWNAYFQSYLLVVHRQSITHAGYILNSFSLASSTFSPIVAFIISYTGNFKLTAYAGVPIVILGTALLLPFRTPDANPGVIALTQVIVGIGTGIFSICAQLAVMVPVTHQEIAAVVALWGLFGSFGSSIGFAIAGAMWNNILPAQLYERLPEASKMNATIIFGDIETQISFLDGTPERDAVVGAYQHVMRLMLITGVCLVPCCLGSIYLWKNVNVRKLEEEKGKQTKGTVW
ncbi:hypothetical protein HBI56_232170 [Parastagonospora nodorum]|uniref:Major facilitator superfamily (MFS) profile domain-containing protein n=2 Tax=Phaeosphaeria nodorum (strain SN15 / ATCC MYA-4574 / FGSC 10173) TaxID=321614 RepID=A0A7U2F709_PHANO|nr:hypothetical protein SNOG_14439 [Parastagonospora nodorum SN15]KAH3904395.1 hypothetical protein HBH56_235480 [Parastagonospora nodorum]EAT78310.1 hypothetical protein SNOG_14439 [Parastagonospora nodorum SN15]KAH3924464.1 hypothetical protein HBH54_192910 [Parastagonospora nodorum]KAH3939198.1 hypothetical protein HBH53_238640 [Parastagonospora nodorum]KAH3957150.1 hypothetical protein HBH51_229700 [Parastagonospora nodorum]